MKKDVKQMVVDMVVNKMKETGKAPWDNGFLNNNVTPINWATKKPYNGVNYFMLMAFGFGHNEYVTYKQCVKAGGKVKKGEHGLPVVWYSLFNKTQGRMALPEDNITKKGKERDEIIPILKYSTVFEISQCEGLEPRREETRERAAQAIEEAEEWKINFCKNTGVEIRHSLGTACCYPTVKLIEIRNIDEFKSDAAYYSTLFHECTHSTAVALNRPLSKHKGNKAYSAEEVIAEMGAMFMCNHFGIIREEVENAAVYIDGWSQKLKANPDWFIKGVTGAEKAFDYMIEKGQVDIDELIA